MAAPKPRRARPRPRPRRATRDAPILSRFLVWRTGIVSALFTPGALEYSNMRKDADMTGGRAAAGPPALSVVQRPLATAPLARPFSQAGGLPPRPPRRPIPRPRRLPGNRDLRIRSDPLRCRLRRAAPGTGLLSVCRIPAIRAILPGDAQRRLPHRRGGPSPSSPLRDYPSGQRAPAPPARRPPRQGFSPRQQPATNPGARRAQSAEFCEYADHPDVRFPAPSAT